MNPQRVVRRLQRGIVALAFLGSLYLVWRVELLRLPPAGCSPVLKYAPGALLLLDGKPRVLHPEDVVLFESEGTDTLYLGVVQRAEDGRYWIVTDDPACPGTDSDDLGWIPEASIRGRALLALPW